MKQRPRQLVTLLSAEGLADWPRWTLPDDEAAGQYRYLLHRG